MKKLMIRPLPFIVALISLTITGVTQAKFEVRAEIRADSFEWDYITFTNDGKLVPNIWEAPPMLQAAESWGAGTFAAAPPTSMTLIGSEASSPSIPISILGVQYNTTGIESDQSSNPVGGGCTTDDVSLPIVTVEGASCVSSTRLINKQKSTPFIFFRPVFNVDPTAVISALKGLPEDVYSASVPVIIRYFYENDGIMTYRNISEVILFSFDYKPAQIDSVFVSGDGVMDPRYDTNDKTIAASTVFDFTVNGNFGEGVVLTLPNQSTFELVNSTNPEQVIPYNIYCMGGCSPMELVSEGQLLNESTIVGDSGFWTTSINFNLTFFYDIEGSTAASGDYFDDVTVLLQPNI